MHEINTTEKLQTLVDRFNTAMLITRPGDGAPKPRPMKIADHTGTSLSFVTNHESDLVEEIERDSGCAVAMQDGGHYVALRGLAEIHNNIQDVRAVWSEALRPWFPHGPTSPRIMLIRFSPLEGEYWDTSGAHMVRLLYRAARAFAQGKPMEHNDPRQHASVAL